MSLPTKRKLLIADDSVAVQKIVQLTFGDEGYTVTAVGDGRRALEQIEQDVPDVVLADVTMPELNGYQICARIKRDERLRGVRVVLLVGAFEPFNEAEARKVGADDFLTKPFQSIRDMVSKVGNLFGGKHEAETAEHEAIQPPVATSATTNDAERAATAPLDTFAAPPPPTAVSPADELILTGNPPTADAFTEFATGIEPAEGAHADSPFNREQDEPLAAEEFSHASVAGDVVVFDEKPFSEKPFADDDDDPNIDVTPFDEAASRDFSEIDAVEVSSSTDAFFNDDDAPMVDAYAEALSVEPDEAASRPNLETTTSDEPNMSLKDATHAHDDATRDDNELLDLDDFSAPMPQAATTSFQSGSAPEAASTADNDDGLLDLDIDVPAEATRLSDAASGDADERIRLDEIFPPRAAGEGETTELVLPEAIPVDAPSPFAVESNLSFNDTSFNDTQRAGSPSLTEFQNVAPQIRTSAPITLDQLAPEAIEEIVRRVVEQMSERVVQEVAWEVVPALAERMIKRRLETDDGGL